MKLGHWILLFLVAITGGILGVALLLMFGPSILMKWGAKKIPVVSVEQSDDDTPQLLHKKETDDGVYEIWRVNGWYDIMLEFFPKDCEESCGIAIEKLKEAHDIIFGS